ncbi:hypothetical protein NKT77_06285 [Moraxella sp. FZLJ2107]|uniref:hypothetical protein n=1 Tax=unclassified Moraxella TaxID=2685852 RepID=UPI0020C8912A|nr:MULTISPECIES: hypothetical protein [unclassified Moraxella]UTO04147.1 hypothetical protein NKT77_06285 [Moraxella sp. FZLJ2107]UTO22980.1 hypothetical protein NKU06_03070 [Moraxella sp. FZLJ2109]
MTLTTRPFVKLFTLSTLCLALAACQDKQADKTATAPAAESTNTTSQNTANTETGGEMSEEFATGPKAAADRALAPTAISTSQDGKATTIAVDFGNATIGKYAAPIRGLIITPNKATTPTPLIVLSHLRAPNCADMDARFPCHDGVAELRFDHGMQYLGEHLAAQGYTVIIPDLSPAFIGLGVTEPYDQPKLWQDIVSRFRDELKAAAADDKHFGTPVAAVDFTTVGLFLHSRSGQMTTAAEQVFGKDNIKSIFAYAPSYETFELADISPAPQDIPYLAIVGSLDTDVGASANLWLSHYTTTPRQTAASTVELSGFGHMSINRTAVQAEMDDRRGCDIITCHDDKAHEKMLLTAVDDWFGATIQGKDSTLPTKPHQALPKTVAGYPARWLALSAQSKGFIDAKDFGDSDGVKYCAYSDPMNPASAIMPACPEPEMGVVQAITPVAYLSNAAKATTNIQGATALALQIAPTGSHGDKGTTVDITLALDDGNAVSLTLDPTDPALIERVSEHDSGMYRLGTVQVDLPKAVQNRTITAVTISSDHPVIVRSVDFW